MGIWNTESDCTDRWCWSIEGTLCSDVLMSHSKKQSIWCKALSVIRGVVGRAKDPIDLTIASCVNHQDMYRYYKTCIDTTKLSRLSEGLS